MDRKGDQYTITPIFRIFIGIYLLFSVVTYLASQAFVSEGRRSQDPISLVTIILNALVLIYLSIPWLEKHLGKAYLPIALAVITISPFAAYFQPTLGLGEEVLRFRDLAWQWQLVIQLFIPLLLISWMYRYWVVVLYSLLIGVINLVFSANIIPLGQVGFMPPPPPQYNVIFFRTAIYLLIGYLTNRLVRELRRQNEELVSANRKLEVSALTREQLATSRERNRLARELHDTVAHTLSAVSIQLEAVRALWDVNSQDARSMLDQSLKMTRSGLNETRQAIMALRLSPLTDLGLPLALKNLANATAERSGWQISLSLPDDGASYPAEVEHSLYRITEEALHNIAQHANAGQVSIRLTERAKHLDLEIRDDGTGFDPDRPIEEGHYGLRGMQEWAEMIGAVFTLQSNSDTGTVVRVSLEVK
ncbi:MAG: sensor histidine kinase [Anaerolineaceae bacterium]